MKENLAKLKKQVDDLKSQVDKLQEEKDIIIKNAQRMNGTSVIITDGTKILLGRANYAADAYAGKIGSYMLPGGAIDRNELPIFGAASEVDEETAYVTNDSDLNLIAVFKQRSQKVVAFEGLVLLYEAKTYRERGSRIVATPELVDVEFFTKNEIFDLYNKGEIYRGYMRILIHYFKYKDKLYSSSVFEKALFDQVDYFYKSKYYVV
jgi:ADP-ribose pyrophosphatase YjhB (NUDIX family)